METAASGWTMIHLGCSRARPGLMAWLGSAAIAFTGAAAGADVLTQHNNNPRRGTNLNETVLNAANVGSGNFGRLWTLYADGQVVAQPLYVANLRIDTAANQNAPLVQGT